MKPLSIVVGTLLVFGPPAGYFAWQALEHREALLAMPVSELPGTVVMYTGPG